MIIIFTIDNRLAVNALSVMLDESMNLMQIIKKKKS